YNYLYINMAEGIFRYNEVPSSLHGYGGRALADALASAFPGSAVFAPGIFSGCRCASNGRLSVVCSSQNGILFPSNAGGAAAEAITALGLSAIVVDGCREERGEDELYDLVIGTGGISVEKSRCRGREISSSMQILAGAWPKATAVLCAGLAGEQHLPMASLAFSGKSLAPSGHAGSSSGAILCRSRIRSMVFLPGKETVRPVNPEGFEKAALRFAQLLNQSVIQGAAHAERCSSRCVINCHKGEGSAAEAGASSGKKMRWPGQKEFWTTGDKAADERLALRFTAICDEIGADAFAVGELLSVAVKDGVIPGSNAERALEEVRKLGEGTSVLQSMALSWPVARRKGKGRQAELQNIVMDSLGICRFAGEAAERFAEVKECMHDMLYSLHGLLPGSLDAMAHEAWNRENKGSGESTDGGRK
ncbi:MAG: aldehyde ferredoxin oxidoreductase N-terminal domain-containing protein, partial [Mailhella sp.]